MTFTLSPEIFSQDKALTTMLSSNENWVQRVTGFCPDFFRKSAQGQQPPVLWIGCSDSRVPDGVVTASPPGQIFTHRNIANQFPVGDTSAQSVLDYAVDSLGVSHVIVVGHTNCGGVNAAFNNAQSGYPPPTSTPLERWLAPLTQRIIDLHIPPSVPRDKAIAIATRENVKMQIENLCKSIQPKVKIHVHGWLYELETGLLEDLQITQSIHVSSAVAE